MTTGESDGRPQGLSVAVVTPYFKESPATLQRCLASVSAQTYPRVIHYMVADGFPQTALLAQWPGVRHVQLPNAHANFGCTPRGIGAQCALADGVDVVCFLDADNLLEPEHVATVVQTVAQAVGDTITFGMISRNQTTKLVGGYSVQLNLTFAPTNVASGAVTFVP